MKNDEFGSGRYFVGTGNERVSELGADGRTYLTIDPDGNIDLQNGAVFTGSTGATWGTITGTLANQTDLQTALDAKISASLLTTRGDLLYRNATIPARLAIGASGSILNSDGTDPQWGMTLARGTITTSDPWTFTQTWNAGGVTFRGVENVYTITAAATASTVERWMGGAAGTTELAYITAGGRIFATPGGLLGGLNTIPAYSFVGAGNAGLDYDTIRGGVAYVSSGVIYAGFNSGGVNIASSKQVNWSSNDDAFGSPDVRMWRDAANILALRNSTNAQTFNWYYSYTDASNYHRGALKTSSTGIEIAAETAGTGADNLDITLTPAGTGGVLLGGFYQQLTEMTAPAAPAANSVRLYAVDNGAGKTQLMALFGSGAAQQVAIEP